MNICKKGVSIITSTNRLNYMRNIYSNYLNQSYKNKELIIILNNNYLNMDKWKVNSKSYDNVRIYQLSYKVSLGDCLNYAVEKSNYDIIAKFDDDDIYHCDYLTDSLKSFTYTDADIVGKSTVYIYFEENNTLALLNPNNENRYLERVHGATLIVNKYVFGKIKFQNINIGEDIKFCKDCKKNGYKIYSTNKNYYVYIRHSNNHTWSIDNNDLMRQCKIIGALESPITTL